MNNLNSMNNSDFALNNTSSYKGDLGNLVLIILIAFLILVVIVAGIILNIYVKTYNQRKIQDQVEEELITYIHNCKNNPIDKSGSSIPSSTLANEYSLNFWLYIKNLNYRHGQNQHILMKGNPDEYIDTSDEFPLSNPSLYIKKNSNNLVLQFELSTGVDISNTGCYNVFDVLNETITSIKSEGMKLKLVGQREQGQLEFSEDSNDLFKLKSIDRDEKEFKIILIASADRANDLYVKLDDSLFILTDKEESASTFHIHISGNSDTKFKLKSDDKYLIKRDKKLQTTDELNEATEFEFEIDYSETSKLQIDNINFYKENENLVKISDENCNNRTRDLFENSGKNSYRYYGMSGEKELDQDETKNSKYCISFQNLNNSSQNRKINDLSCDSNSLIQVNSTSTRSVKFEIPNIPIQRWACMNITVHDRTVDIYIDGGLIKTEVLPSPPKINDYPLIIGNNGGFDGYISRMSWANKALHPDEIYNKYKQGPRVSETILDRIKNTFGI